MKVLPISAKQAREAYESDDWLCSYEAKTLFDEIEYKMMSDTFLAVSTLSEEAIEALKRLGYKVQSHEFLDSLMYTIQW